MYIKSELHFTVEMKVPCNNCVNIKHTSLKCIKYKIIIINLEKIINIKNKNKQIYECLPNLKVPKKYL